MSLNGKRILIAKPGLDGHDVGAKVIALALRDAGAEVIYTGLRKAPDFIANVAVEEDVDAVGLSILSGSHMELVAETARQLRALDGEWLGLPSIQSLDLGQPELNDLDAIYAKAAAKQVPLIRLAASEADICSGEAGCCFPTGVVVIHRAKDFQSARAMLRKEIQELPSTA